MGPSKTTSMPPVTDEIDNEWDGFVSQEAPTIPGARTTDSDRPTALPPEPPEKFAKRLMAGALSAEEERRALSTTPTFRVPARESMATLVDVNAGSYDIPESEEFDAPIPVIDLRSETPEIDVVVETDAGLDLELDLNETSGSALELVASHSTPADAAEEGDPIHEMRDRYAVGDFTGALAIAEALLIETPGHAEAQRCLVNCRDVLTQMYRARIGALNQVPVVVLPADQIRWLTLDHRSGFLLSCIDGHSNVEEILDVSGMPQLDALRILCELLQQNVIELNKRG